MASGPRLLNQALQKSITARAGARALRGQESVFIYTYRGEHRISTLIANKVGGGFLHNVGAARCSDAPTCGCCVCVPEQPEGDGSREQRAEQELLQQQRPQRVRCRSASKDQDGKYAEVSHFSHRNSSNLRNKTKRLDYDQCPDVCPVL